MITVVSIEFVSDLLQKIISITTRTRMVLRNGKISCTFKAFLSLHQPFEPNEALAPTQVRHHQVRLQQACPRKCLLRSRVIGSFKQNLTERKQGQFVVRILSNHRLKRQ